MFQNDSWEKGNNGKRAIYPTAFQKRTRNKCHLMHHRTSTGIGSGCHGSRDHRGTRNKEWKPSSASCGSQPNAYHGPPTVMRLRCNIQTARIHGTLAAPVAAMATDNVRPLHAMESNHVFKLVRLSSAIHSNVVTGRSELSDRSHHISRIRISIGLASIKRLIQCHGRM